MTAAHAMLARELLEAERSAVAVPPLSERHPKLTIEDAYEIQRAGRELRLAGGEVLAGRKIGLTSRAMQEMLGVDQPDFGCLYASLVVDSGTAVEVSRLIAPRAEAEIAFVLGSDLEGPGVSRADALAAAESVLPAIEVIDSRVANWRITIIDTIADNASGGMAVLGEPQPLDGLDLAEMKMTIRAGEESVGGCGNAVLGHPAEPVAWLANMLSTLGERLRRGDVVLPGALARALPVAAGQEARAEFGPLGSVSVRFE